VVLSGGVFQNPLFVQLMTSFLQRDGLRPHVAAKVPPNDGGIALGQAVIALNTALG
jgi:hydrogenase maturation protein HypF